MVVQIECKNSRQMAAQIVYYKRRLLVITLTECHERQSLAS